MFEKRTDLALEVKELRGEESGITAKEETLNGIKITRAEILSGEGERLSGKKAGIYTTLEIGRFWQEERSRACVISQQLSREICALVPDESGCVLIAGLGNDAITADSIGPKAVKRLLVTRHLQELDPSLYKTAGFECVAAIAPGVLGQTGIESAEIIKSVAESIKPKCIILIDALASRRLERLATTIQISNSGISPGSGVSNKRRELNAEYLGAPVVSIGVPTVVDAATLALDVLEDELGEISAERFEQIAKSLATGSESTMFVTPKESDVITEAAAKLIADALNMAIHKMSPNEINEFIG
ncbi:MAG: GPR endopeptidase [Clostridia bacterium]|nr:GPR endopeptidase [Clostridia bacterium]